MTRRPKPKPGEVNAVDPSFKPPGLPRCTIAEKKKFLAILDRLIVQWELWLETLNDPDDSPAVRDRLTAHRLQAKGMVTAYTWLHQAIDAQHPIEHREMIDDGRAEVL